jgi:hypothetical protein
MPKAKKLGTLAAPLMRAQSALPVSVDLTAFAPPAGDQGQVNSCAAWAVDYTAMGYWENKQGIAGGRLAPMYTYAQLVRGQNTGTYIDDHLTIARQQGVDSRSDYTQGDYDYTNLPTAHEVSNAAHWKVSGFTDLAVGQSAASTVTQQSIEGALAAGNPVVIGIPVYNNFFSVSSTNHGYYASVSGPLAGYHAVTALGYDATGLRIENQWSGGWGDRGFATLSWAFVNQYVFQATSVSHLVATGPAPGVATSPIVTGTGVRGQTLTGTAGTWTNSPTAYNYQWQRYAAGAWSNIVGATASSYALQLADENAQVRLRVTATNAGGLTAAYSLAVGPVVAAPPAVTVAPAVSGTAARGSVLRGTGGTWSGAGNVYTYQWQRDTGSGYANIIGATGASYTLQVADAGAHVRLRVTATNPDGSVASWSVPVGPVSMDAPVLTASPTVTGTATRGSLLRGTTGTWTGAGNVYTYQWQRYASGAWSNIIGATGTTYTLQTADVGAQVRLRVIATNPGGFFASYSHATATVT